MKAFSIRVPSSIPLKIMQLFSWLHLNLNGRRTKKQAERTRSEKMWSCRPTSMSMSLMYLVGLQWKWQHPLHNDEQLKGNWIIWKEVMIGAFYFFLLCANQRIRDAGVCTWKEPDESGLQPVVKRTSFMHYTAAAIERLLRVVSGSSGTWLVGIMGTISNLTLDCSELFLDFCVG